MVTFARGEYRLERLHAANQRLGEPSNFEMNKRLVRIAVAASACLCPASLGYSQPPPSRILFRHVRAFDGDRLLSDQNVLVENGRIARVTGGRVKAEGAEVIEGEGKTLLPGFIDAHVHIGAAVKSALAQCLSFGVTTVFDMFNAGDRFETMKAIRSEDPPDAADLRTAGVGATAPGGAPANMGGPPFPAITGPEEAQSFVDARIAEGSDYIKIIYDDLRVLLGAEKTVPKLSAMTLRALIEAAHKRGRLAVVHITTEQAARDAVEAGADGLVHMFMGESSGDIGQLAAKHHIFVIPTLSALYAACNESDGPSLLADLRLTSYIRPAWRPALERTWPGARPSCDSTRKGLRELLRAKVPILAGTDAPTPGTTYGASLHGELALLVRGGLSPLQALAAATSVPAQVFRLPDRGRLRPGMRADLVLVEGDPSADIDATRNIKAVWKRGIRIQR